MTRSATVSSNSLRNAVPGRRMPCDRHNAANQISSDALVHDDAAGDMTADDRNNYLCDA